MNPRRLISLICVVAAMTALLGPAPSDTFTYSTLRRQVRAGIIVSRSLEFVQGNANRGSENPDPHVFYVLDSRSDLKPFGMEFVNPLAPSTVTGEIYERWSLRNIGNDPAFVPGQPQAEVFRVGSRVTKNMGAYWEVNIDTLTPDELKQYDLLYLHSHLPNISFTADVREKLRRFVDSGGTLWVDNAGGMSFATIGTPGSPFLLDVTYPTGNLQGTGSGAVIAAPNHPLLSYPYLIGGQEVQSLGDKLIGAFGGLYVADGIQPPPGGQPRQVAAGETLVPIIWNTLGTAPAGVEPNPAWRPWVLAGMVGAGRLVFTSSDVGSGINDHVGGANAGYGGNSGAISGDFVIGAKPVDLRFGYNLASWSAVHRTANADVRHTGKTEERIGAALEGKWAPPVLPGTAKVGGAAYYKNFVYAVDGNLVLRCYDARPAQDLDGNGNPDDGIPDYIAGYSQDEIWNVPLQLSGGAPTGPGASTPTVIEFYDPTYIDRNGTATNGLANFNQRELVIVTLSDSTIVAVRANPRQAGVPGLPLAPVSMVEWVVQGDQAAFQPYPIDNNPRATGSWDKSVLTDLPIPSVSFSEGIVFAAVNTSNGGRVLAIDPKGGRSAFAPGTGAPAAGQHAETTAVPDVTGMPPIISSPTVASVLDQASGAVDKVVSVSVINTPTAPASIRTFWFAARGEPLSRLNPTTLIARPDRPVFLVDPANVGDKNWLLRPRLYHTFRDPSGVVATREFNYRHGGAAQQPALQMAEFTVDFTGNQVRVYTNAQVTAPPPFGVIPSNDERNSFYLDYTLDWRTINDGGAPKQANEKVIWRSQFNLPDVGGVAPPGGTQAGGAPMIAPDDTMYYSVATDSSGPAAGVIVAAYEQHLRSRARWAFTMHDGFTLPVTGGQALVIPPRLRQLDPNVPGYWDNGLTGVQFIGTPAYKDNTIYALARANVGQGGPAVSVLCAFRANPEIRFSVRNVDPSQPLRVRQVNLVKSTTVGAALQPVWVDLQQGTNFSIQWARNPNNPTNADAVITVHSSSPTGSLEAFASTSMPFLVLSGTAGNEVPIFGQHADVNLLTNARETRIIGPAGVDNLLWYAVIPTTVDALPVGLVSSSPAVVGGVVWMGTQNGFLLSFDADPAANDPTIRSGGQALIRDFQPPNSNARIPGHLRAVMRAAQQPLLAGNAPAITSPPAGTENLLIANTFNGVNVFEDALTLIADNKRLIEVNSAGDATWTADGTRTVGVAGGDLPYYVFDPNTGQVGIGNPVQATGVPVAQNVPFSRPSAARRIGMNDVLVVDTGNNRIAQVDRGGNVVWEVHRLFDAFGLLRPGDPLTLNEPTDVQYWSEYTERFVQNPLQVNIDGTVYTYNQPAHMVHYLISDTGNYRVIELVDIYDLSGRPVVPTAGGTPAPFSMLRQVWFVSSSVAQGRRYRYRSVQRIYMRNADLPPEWQGDPFNPGQPAPDLRQLTLTAVANARLVGNPQTAVNAGGDLAESGGGSLLMLNEAGNPLMVISNIRVPGPATPQYPAGFRMQPIVNPTWFSKFDELDPQTGRLVFKYLLADENGVYQLRHGQNLNYLDVEWLLTNDDYYRITGKRLRASSVRRLAGTSGNPNNPTLRQFLIANRFSGQDDPAVFGVSFNGTGNPANGNIAGRGTVNGEVFVINPTTFDLTAAGHGYQPSYVVVAPNMLVRNPAASVTWTSPREELPAPGVQIGVIRRVIGDPSRATSTSVLEQPAFADRPF